MGPKDSPPPEHGGARRTHLRPDTEGPYTNACVRVNVHSYIYAHIGADDSGAGEDADDSDDDDNEQLSAQL